MLQGRAREALGHYVSHPHAVSVTVQEGIVTLTGDVLAVESAGACRGLRHGPGVRRVEERWRVHQDATGVPGLQGPTGRRAPMPEFLQRHWSLVARAGAAAIWLGSRRARPRWLGRFGRWALAAVRAMTNRPALRLFDVADRTTTEHAPAASDSPMETVRPLRRRSRTSA